MKIGTFEFSMRELAGSMGDFGTLLPLAIGYIVVCDLDPAGFLLMMGVANIATGLAYRLPVPIEPMKVLAVVAIAQAWSPQMVYASGFAMGLVWLVFAMTGIIEWISQITPTSVIRGIQVTLGVLLAMEAFKMVSTGWVIGIGCVILVLLLRDNRHAPAAIVLMLLGVVIMLIRGQFGEINPPSFSLPPLTSFGPEDVWETLVLAGFAQIPLTATNATIATSSLIDDYFPDRSVSEKQLSWNQGIMNAIVPFFGGMPMCHGAGGLAGQYYFGARTGGANILEGLIEIFLGLFLSASIAGIFSVFPMAIVGAMMFLVGIELTKFAGDVAWDSNMIPLLLTVAVSLLTNMAVGFLAGLVVHYLIRHIAARNAG
jgi:hypothetical protein